MNWSNNLEFVTLKRYCDKYGLDYQEIDNSLTYNENKKHLRALVKMLNSSLDTFEMARMAELQKQYLKEYPIDHYLACQMAHETTSAEVGQLIELPPFSLKTWVEVNGRNNQVVQKITA